ncbi:MAG: metallophosphoesterase [Eubacterium sp.]
MEENFIRVKPKMEITLYILLTAGVSWYVSERLGHVIWHFLGLNLSASAVTVFALTLFLILFQGAVKIPRGRRFTSLFRITIWISGLYCAYIVYLFLVLFPLDMLVLLEKIPAIRIHPLDYYNDVLIATLASIYIIVSGMIHANALKTVKYSVSIAGLEKPLRITHLSDLHMGSVIGRPQIRRIVNKANAMHPDLVLISGDLFNHNDVRECAHLDDLAGILRGLQSKYGTFAVAGNHDPAPDDQGFQDFLQSAGIRLLDNQAEDLGQLVLAGRTGNVLKQRPEIQSWYHTPETAVTGNHDKKPVILLDHYPDSIIEAEEMGFSLLLAGHTHNGQYFPCNYLIRLRYRGALRHGYTQVRHVKCIVSSGSGYFQIPIRVGTDSEIGCIDLVPEVPIVPKQTI